MIDEEIDLIKKNIENLFNLLDKKQKDFENVSKELENILVSLKKENETLNELLERSTTE